jgi:hypothetical protein
MEEFDDFEHFTEPYNKIVKVGRERINPLHFNKEKFNLLISGVFSITICLSLQIGSGGILKCKKGNKEENKKVQSDIKKSAMDSYYQLNNQTNSTIDFVNKTQGNETIDSLPTCKAIEERIRLANEGEDDGIVLFPERNRTSRRRLRGHNRTKKDISPESPELMPLGNESIPFQPFEAPSKYIQPGHTSFTGKWMNFGNNDLFSLPKKIFRREKRDNPRQAVEKPTKDSDFKEEVIVEGPPKPQASLYNWWVESTGDDRDKMYKVIIPDNSSKVSHRNRHSEFLNIKAPLNTTEPYPISRMISSISEFFFGKKHDSSKQEHMDSIIESLNKRANGISQNVTTVCELLILGINDNPELLQKLQSKLLDPKLKSIWNMNGYFTTFTDKQRIDYLKQSFSLFNSTDVGTFDDITTRLQDNYCRQPFQPVLEFKSTYLNQSEYHGHIYYLSNYFKGSLPFHMTSITSLLQNSAITVFQELKEITKILVEEVSELHGKYDKPEPSLTDTDKLLKLRNLKTQLELFREIIKLEDSSNFFYSPVLTFDPANDNDFFLEGLKTIFSIYQRTSELVQFIHNPLEYFRVQTQNQGHQRQQMLNITHNEQVEHLAGETLRTFEFNELLKSNKLAVDTKNNIEADIWSNWMLYYPKTFIKLIVDFATWTVWECINLTKYGIILISGVGLLGATIYWMVTNPMQFLNAGRNILNVGANALNTGADFMNFIFRNLRGVLQPRPVIAGPVPGPLPNNGPPLHGPGAPLNIPRQSSSSSSHRNIVPQQLPSSPRPPNAQPVSPNGQNIALVANADDIDVVEAQVDIIPISDNVQVIQVFDQIEQSLGQNDTDTTVSVTNGSTDSIISYGGAGGGGACVSIDDTDNVQIGLFITRNRDDEDLIQFIQRIKNAEIEKIYTIRDNRLHCFKFVDYNVREDTIHGSNIKTGNIELINEDHIVTEHKLLTLMSNIDDDLCETKLIKLKENTTLFDVVHNIDESGIEFGDIYEEPSQENEGKNEWIEGIRRRPSATPSRANPLNRSRRVKPVQEIEKPLSVPVVQEIPVVEEEIIIPSDKPKTPPKINRPPHPLASMLPRRIEGDEEEIVRPPNPFASMLPPRVEGDEIIPSDKPKTPPKLNRQPHPLASMIPKVNEGEEEFKRPPNPFAAGLQEGIKLKSRGDNKPGKTTGKPILTPMEEMQLLFKNKKDKEDVDIETKVSENNKKREQERENKPIKPRNIAEEMQSRFKNNKDKEPVDIDKQIAERNRIKEEEEKKKKRESAPAKPVNPFQEMQLRIQQKEAAMAASQITEEQQKIIDQEKTAEIERKVAENNRIREEEKQKKKIESMFDIDLLNRRSAIRGKSKSKSSSDKSDWDE